MTTHIMVDLETMGMAPNGAIASIGAVKFDPFTDELYDPFHVAVDLDGQEMFGRVITGSTVKWWFKQEQAARDAIMQYAVSLENALKQFARYVGGKSVPCWAYGATFDHSILQSAYDSGAAKPYVNPIHYRDQLCMRGLAKLANVECPHVPGVAHNAVDDATRQARWVQAIMRKFAPPASPKGTTLE